MKKTVFLLIIAILMAVTVAALLAACRMEDRRRPMGNSPGFDFYDPDDNPLMRTPEMRNPIVTPNVPNNYPNRGEVRPRGQRRDHNPGQVNVRPGMDFIRKK